MVAQISIQLPMSIHLTHVYDSKMADVLKTHVFKVEMTCEGCSKAISNVLNKHKDKGITNFDVNLQENLVTVETSMALDTLTEIFRKTGKKTTYVEEKK